MAFGIETFRAHLDLIPTIFPGGDFFRWNGEARPIFAGRNFLGGDFLWGHGEATNALQNPSPEDLNNLILSVPLIAPVVAPQPARQQRFSTQGFLYGAIDADAICSRLRSSILAGEFSIPASRFVHVWLAVDPTVALSADYWAGWSNKVNNFVIAFGGLFHMQVLMTFRACVLCRYMLGPNGKLAPDPVVTGALDVASLDYAKQADTRCHAFWADAPAGALPDAGLPRNPILDWNRFDNTKMPSIWRFSGTFRKPDGAPAEVPFGVDAVRDPGGGALKATDFMLITEQWQPNVASILNYGFVVFLGPPDHPNGINNMEIARTNANPFPALTDLGAHYNLPGGSVFAVGRYLKTPGHGRSLNREEAERLSNAGLQIFTVWESFNVAAGGEPTMNDPPPAVQKAFKVGIAYFSAAAHAGTEDGMNAFSYCGNTLRQPPQTPVFFCVDFDAADPGDTAPVTTAQARKRIEDYFTLVKAQRDAYAQRNPHRYYLIGVYGNGEVNRWCYEQGIVSAFWQSVGPGSTGNVLPRRPWYHATRWQFNKESGLNPHWPHVLGADPDADWGDGGTWILTDQLAQQLEQLEVQEAQQLFQDMFGDWGNLLDVIP